jgi:hypothetical protein
VVGEFGRIFAVASPRTVDSGEGKRFRSCIAFEHEHTATRKSMAQYRCGKAGSHPSKVQRTCSGGRHHGTCPFDPIGRLNLGPFFCGFDATAQKLLDQ